MACKTKVGKLTHLTSAGRLARMSWKTSDLNFKLAAQTGRFRHFRLLALSPVRLFVYPCDARPECLFSKEYTTGFRSCARRPATALRPSSSLLDVPKARSGLR